MPLVYVYLVLSLYLISLYDCRYLAPFVRSPVPTLLVGACWLALCVPWEKSLGLSLCVLESWDQREKINKIQPSNGSKILYSSVLQSFKTFQSMWHSARSRRSVKPQSEGQKGNNSGHSGLGALLWSYQELRTREKMKKCTKTKLFKGTQDLDCLKNLADKIWYSGCRSVCFHLAARLCRRTQGPKECAVGVRKNSVTCHAVLRCTWISLHNCSNQPESRTTCLIISVLTTDDNNLMVISQWWWQRARNRMTMTQRLGTGWWPKKLQHARAGLGQRE